MKGCILANSTVQENEARKENPQMYEEGQRSIVKKISQQGKEAWHIVSLIICS